MAGGLALTPLCVLIQHRGRVSGVKGSVGQEEEVVSGGDLEGVRRREVGWCTCPKVGRLS